jgi:hypothetical protein
LEEAILAEVKSMPGFPLWRNCTRFNMIAFINCFFPSF